MKAFCGGKSSLSNLHKCPEGCILHVGDNEYSTSEHYYQFHKLMAHDKWEEAYALLEEENAFKVIQTVQCVLPPEQISDNWKSEMQDKMVMANVVKFWDCPHAMEELLACPPLIAEATGDKYWGTSLNEVQMVECISEYWPGENHMGKILMGLQKHFLEERNSKQKAESPLASESKHSDHGVETFDIDANND